MGFKGLGTTRCGVSVIQGIKMYKVGAKTSKMIFLQRILAVVSHDPMFPFFGGQGHRGTELDGRRHLALRPKLSQPAAQNPRFPPLQAPKTHASLHEVSRFSFRFPGSESTIYNLSTTRR